MSELDVDGAGGVPALDPAKTFIVSAWGKKGSGKSFFNSSLYQGWPWDKLAIDVNGNADVGPDAEKISLPLPKKFPDASLRMGERRRPRNLHFVADPGSDTYRDDLDRAVRLALLPQAKRTLLWAGEVGELMPNGRPGPHMARSLMQSRHYNVSCLFDGPRPVWVDPQVLLQSDLVVVFELPNPADRKRIAETIGWEPREFEREYHETQDRGDFWHLIYDARGRRLYRCPPVPRDTEPPRVHVESERADRPKALTA